MSCFTQRYFDGGERSNFQLSVHVLSSSLGQRHFLVGFSNCCFWGGSVHICRRSRGHPSSNGTSFSSLRGYIILRLSYLFVISLFSYKSSFSIQPKKRKKIFKNSLVGWYLKYNCTSFSYYTCGSGFIEVKKCADLWFPLHCSHQQPIHPNR